MRLAIVAFACGVGVMQRQAQLPDASMLGAGLALAGACALFAALSRRWPWARGGAVIVCAAVIGFGWAALWAHVRLADRLEPDWEGRDIELTGVVASLPQITERSVRFEFEVERALPAEARVPSRVLLSWWGRPDALPAVRAGERWRLTVRLKQPHGHANPHGFDYERWLFERGLRATGSVRTRPLPQKVDALVDGPEYYVERARDVLRSRILGTLHEKPYAGVIAALAVGDQRAIPAAQWQVFTRTGVNHLMSISGLHVTMIAGLAYALVAFTWRRSARLVLWWPAAKAAAVAGVLGAFGYTLLSGFAVPAQRTLYMVAVVAAASLLGLRTRPSVVLCVALLVVLLADPWAISAAGFWLSFGAVAAIFFVVSGRMRQSGWLVGWSRTQAAVTFALLPLTLALFGQFSIVSPIANAFAIPVVSLLVVPVALVGMVLPFEFVLHVAHALMSACGAALQWMSHLSGAVWEQHAPPEWAVVLGVAGAGLLLLPRGAALRLPALLFFLPLFAAAPAALKPGELRVVVLDVGQGLSVFVQTAGHALLYDTGPAFGATADSGTRVIAPYLRATGVRRLDGLMVSHDDNDHTGGAVSVVQALPVRWVATSLGDTDPLAFIAERTLPCAAGQSWVWDGVRFDVLHPVGEEASGKDNDRSCVLRIVAPGGTVLLPGDIEKRGEAALLASAAALQADVLVAPHQGSRTSSTPGFVAAVTPRNVIFPVGYRNVYGHPHPEVVARYTEAGAQLFRTDRDGAVEIRVQPDRDVSISSWRETYRRYWQHGAS